MKTHTLTDCEGIALDSGVPFNFSCCDCGLTHQMVLVSEDEKPIGFAVKRDPDATEKRRASQHQLRHPTYGTLLDLANTIQAALLSERAPRIGEMGALFWFAHQANRATKEPS